MNHNAMIEILSAHRDGKPLQFRDKNSERDWEDLSPNCFGANFTKYDYRVKPMPTMPRSWWVAILRGDIVIACNSKEELLESCTLTIGMDIREVIEVIPQ